MATRIDTDSNGFKALYSVDESEKARIAKKRGLAASKLPAGERQKFVAAQGAVEGTKKAKGTARPEEYRRLEDEADRVEALGGSLRGTGLRSYKKGGKVKKTGVYKLHKGERVLNPKQTRNMSALFGK